MADPHDVDAPPAGADGWRAVWNEDRRFPPRGSRFEGLLRPLRRLVRRALEPDEERQKNYNLVLLDLLRDLRGDLESIRTALAADIASVQKELAQALSEESHRLRELVLIAARRNDALAAALDQKIETVAVRIRDVTNPALASAPDVVYRRLEDALRGSEAHVRADVLHYVGLAAAHQPVLDVGCGRGEFLAACQEAGIEARGVDTNERSVADLVQRGLPASIGSIPECLTAVPGQQLGAILAMHVVEHLPVDELLGLFREASRTLRRGGLLMIETPNAESIQMTGSDFWRDPTHLAPRHAAALTVLAREHGFAIDEIRAVHELPEGTKIPILESDPPELQRVIHAVNDRLFAPQDLRLVLRKE